MRCRHLGATEEGAYGALRLEGASLLGGGPRGNQLVHWASQNDRAGGMRRANSFASLNHKEAEAVQGFGVLLAEPDDETPSDHPGRQIEAAVLYHYDQDTNVGTIYDLLIRQPMDSELSRACGLALLRQLLDVMVKEMCDAAVLKGRLSGCNVVFAAVRSHAGLDPDPHRLLTALNILCLDLPTERLLDEDSLFSLGLLVLDEVPMVAASSGDAADRYYVPTIVVERLLRLHALLAHLLGHGGDELESQLLKLRVRSKIPSTEWSRELRWMVIDLSEEFDEKLLRGYHSMSAQYTEPGPPLEELRTRLLDEDDVLHVVVALFWNASLAQYDIVGGLRYGRGAS